MEEKHSIRISELAYAVGFNDPKYFSACFKKEFGMLPSEYIERFIQWNPDLIYFTYVKLTVNYEVQKLSGNYFGEEYIVCDLTIDNLNTEIHKMNRSICCTQRNP